MECLVIYVMPLKQNITLVSKSGVIYRWPRTNIRNSCLWNGSKHPVNLMEMGLPGILNTNSKVCPMEWSELSLSTAASVSALRKSWRHSVCDQGSQRANVLITS